MDIIRELESRSLCIATTRDIYNMQKIECNVGIPAFKDYKGFQYYTGDVLEISLDLGFKDTSIVSKIGEDPAYIMGYRSATEEILKNTYPYSTDVNLYKRYTEIKAGEKYSGLQIVKRSDIDG